MFFKSGPKPHDNVPYDLVVIHHSTRGWASFDTWKLLKQTKDANGAVIYETRVPSVSDTHCNWSVSSTPEAHEAFLLNSLGPFAGGEYTSLFREACTYGLRIFSLTQTVHRCPPCQLMILFLAHDGWIQIVPDDERCGTIWFSTDVLKEKLQEIMSKIELVLSDCKTAVGIAYDDSFLYELPTDVRKVISSYCRLGQAPRRVPAL
jgi:hypothetical protein